MQRSSSEALTLVQPPRVRVVPRSELAYEPEGTTRGHAHIGFDDYPAGAPGRLDLDPLVLFARGEMRPGEVMDMHPHQDMEIVDVVLEGSLGHRDSLGDEAVVSQGDAMLLSAGRGVEHGAWTVGEVPVQVLVIWVRPAEQGASPKTHVRRSAELPRQDGWRVIASGAPGTGALPVGRDVLILERSLAPNGTAAYRLAPGRTAYLHVEAGSLTVNGQAAGAGDRILVEGSGTFTLATEGGARVFLADLV